MKRKLFPYFTAVLSCSFISYAVIIGFATIYLQYQGFNNTAIGIFYALSSAFCILLQSILGFLLDRCPRLTAKHVFLLQNTITMISSFIIFTCNIPWMILICYITIGAVLLSQNTLVISLGMEYINKGIELNYSLSRGIGSLGYALATLFVGFIVQKTSILYIVPFFLILSLVQFLFLFILPSPPQKQSSSTAVVIKKGYISFFKDNHNLLFLFLSLLLIYFSYSSINNFHINIIENVGGNSAVFGISISLAAFLELPAMTIFQPLSKRFEYKKILIFSCCFFFIKAFILLCATNMWMVYLSQTMQFFSFGLFTPAASYYLNSILSDQDKAKGQSLLKLLKNQPFI